MTIFLTFPGLIDLAAKGPLFVGGNRKGLATFFSHLLLPPLFAFMRLQLQKNTKYPFCRVAFVRAAFRPLFGRLSSALTGPILTKSFNYLVRCGYGKSMQNKELDWFF